MSIDNPNQPINVSTEEISKTVFCFLGEFGYEMISWIPYLLYLKNNLGLNMTTISRKGSAPFYYFSDNHIEVESALIGDMWGDPKHYLAIQKQMPGRILVYPGPDSINQKNISVGGIEWTNKNIHSIISTFNHQVPDYSFIRDTLPFNLPSPYVVINNKFFRQWFNIYKAPINFFDRDDLIEMRDFLYSMGFSVVYNHFVEKTSTDEYYSLDDSGIFGKDGHSADLSEIYSKIEDVGERNRLQLSIYNSSEFVIGPQGGNLYLPAICKKDLWILMRNGDYMDYLEFGRLYNIHVNAFYEPTHLIAGIKYLTESHTIADPTERAIFKVHRAHLGYKYFESENKLSVQNNTAEVQVTNILKTTEAENNNAGKQEKLRNGKFCLFVNTFYGAFLNSVYSSDPSLASKSYLEQKNTLQGYFFGDSDFYSEGLKKAGWNSDDLIINCLPLQKRWAIENNSQNSGFALLVEQVRKISPDVVYIQDLAAIPQEVLSELKKITSLVAGQIATPYSENIPFGMYDVIFSTCPHFIEEFRSKGVTAYYQPLAFEERVLQKQIKYEDRKIDVSFVGGISQLHKTSYRLLEVLVERTPVKIWGYGKETLQNNSPILARHQGEAWGCDMFSILQNSKITINRHGEIAKNYAANMRLYEATGSGSLLVTDYKDNLNELFTIGWEAVAFRSPEEAADLVNYYLNNPLEAAKIAEAGQRRTLREHTYSHRMSQTAEILERHLKYRSSELFKQTIDYSKVSYGYQNISEKQITGELKKSWQNDSIPLKQRQIVQKSLAEIFKGNVPAECQVLADFVKPYFINNDELLEIGCSSGYYYEILEYLLLKRVKYTGVDFSHAFIKMAHEFYPGQKFYVADGKALPFKDNHFRFVVSGGILLHVMDYKDHIRETVRIADKYVIAHRTPVCKKKSTYVRKKFAYEVETIELTFNEDEIINEFLSHDLELIGRAEYAQNQALDEYQVSYMFRKKGR